MEYYEQSTVQRGNAASTCLPPESVRSNQIPVFTSLAQQNRLLDNMYFITPENTEEQTVEEEYHSYLTASVSPPETNVLTFWEVSELSVPTNINLLFLATV